MSGSVLSGPLILGPVQFSGFEIPETLSFGGTQRLAVHKLPGGGRVIDAMGADDAPLCWSGIFSGADAADRARLLDIMRIAGTALPLMWDSFSYIVVIREFTATYCSPWWVPYRISCVVVSDPLVIVINAASSLFDSVSGDLASAASYGINISAASSALAAAVSTTASSNAPTMLSSTSLAPTNVALTASSLQSQANFATAQQQLGAADFPTVLSAAGQLAQLATGNAYLTRASTNISNAGR